MNADPYFVHLAMPDPLQVHSMEVYGLQSKPMKSSGKVGLCPKGWESLVMEPRYGRRLGFQEEGAMCSGGLEAADDKHVYSLPQGSLS